MLQDVPVLATIAASVLGALLGCLTGLLPGLHSNNVATFVGGNPGLLLGVATSGLGGTGDPGWDLAGAAAIIACAVAHTIANIVPSVFLAIPDGDTALSVLPGHRMALAGRGHEALRLSVTSSLASLGMALALVVPVRMAMVIPGGLYDRLMTWLAPILLLVSVLLVLREGRGEGRAGAIGGWRASVAAMAILLAAGVLGQVALFEAEAVAPLFIGLFGIPLLLAAISGASERATPIEVAGMDDGVGRMPWSSVVRGTLAGTVVGWLPGVSSAQATILAVTGDDVREVGDDDGARRFIAGVSAVNTANVVFNLVALATLLRIRSGATSVGGGLRGWSDAPWGEGALPGMPVALLLASAAIGGLLAVPITLRAGKGVSKLLPLLSDRRSLVVLSLILVAACVAWGGWFAGLVVLASTALGVIPPLLGLMRVHLMGAVSLPLAMSLFAL